MTFTEKKAQKIVDEFITTDEEMQNRVEFIRNMGICTEKKLTELVEVAKTKRIFFKESLIKIFDEHDASITSQLEEALEDTRSMKTDAIQLMEFVEYIIKNL